MINLYYHVLTAFFVYGFLFYGEWLLQPVLDKREPPLLKHKVPLLGDFIGLVRKGPEYYTAVARKTRPACFTLDIFGTRTYTVNTSQIIHSIQRNAKTLSFAPLIPYMAERIAGLRSELWKTWFADSGRYNEGMGAEHARLIHHTLYPPEGTRQMNHDVLAELKPLMDDIGSWEPTLGIHKWVVHVDYKAGNPGASTLVTMRRKLFEDHGFKVQDIAQFEAGMSTPILSNTAPALFWLLREIYSRPRFLRAVRTEIGRAVERKVLEDGQVVLTLNVPRLKKDCPLLLGTYHEVLRQHGIGMSARRVIEDTICNRKDFDAARFVRTDDAFKDEDGPGPGPGPGHGPSGLHKPISRPAHSFRSFGGEGGAPHLCPGRQIATLEILCIAAMLIARYDVDPVLGHWSYPKLTYIMSGIAMPSTDIQVRMNPLVETEGDWSSEMGPHHLKFGLA
ncbi:hypothetical protein A1O3_02495 [Capronia epimyces CBS 606.96]|uniref:Cytochrome P450 n=1 Tax=Capronia epimyces CBS 606.96 TaxID=1182542 RepID=W9YAA7_9EURO|nr:uncharacterized protein A1O3_02495 [Capronia epimyces CBS 606.96]EXJ89428.1 hypothetical protein A1O3_02495 [Capronia epimyces CBS 606.96]